MKKLKKGGIAEISGTALSIAIGLFLLSIIIGVGYVTWNSVKKAQEISNVNTISTGMQNLNLASGYGSSDYSSVLINSGAIPSNIKVVGGAIYNSYGGTITPAGNGAGYSITETNLPSKICIGLISGTNTTDLESTKINNTSFSSAVSATDASTACSGNTNSVVFNYRS